MTPNIGWRFRRIDTIVVIVVLAIFLALLAMWIPQSRSGTMSRICCANNQRQIGGALIYVVNQSPNQQFPGYRNVIKRNASDESKSSVASWIVMALPGLQQKPLYDQFRNANPPTKIPYLEVLVCPNDPPENNQSPALDYVVNCGKPDSKYTDRAANGLFFDKTIRPKSVNSTMAGIVDGAECTLMLSENMNLPNLLNRTSGWGESGFATDSTAVKESSFGFVWWNDNKQSYGSVSPYRKINGGRLPDRLLPAATADDLARPASNHNGGVNVCFASGREMWLREDIPYYVYQQLMTPDGANADPVAKDDAGSEYNLTDQDYR